ncbi:MAG: 50S ribosomal protein L23 [Calditrichaceae bacterium]|nr:50S ribosomal protein L23 [Calditrichaceae bacterium]MBN2709099.1 50S ribosomal protein L23 [Calditrichaceae bacterium]RQV97056.1 MAG: 50S ribosomal protein L23 [Calditrichota bacterium]
MSVREIEVLPMYTEKMANLQDNLNQYAFKVSKEANKIEIKTVIEKRFDVKIKSIRTMNVVGKMRQQLTRKGRFYGRRASWKKAIVTLESGQKLELFGNA